MMGLGRSLQDVVWLARACMRGPVCAAAAPGYPISRDSARHSQGSSDETELETLLTNDDLRLRPLHSASHGTRPAGRPPEGGAERILNI